MASAVLPKSLQRTDSTGQLNVFLLLKKKSNDDLILISREDLPPTLRSGKLVLNQKIIIRDEERNSIEGVIVYMNTDRENCLSFKKQVFENKMQNNEAGVISNSSASHSSSSRTNVSTRCPTIITKRSNAPPTTAQKSTKSSSSNKKPVEAPPKVLYEAGEYQERSFSNSNTIDLSNVGSLPSPHLHEKNKSRTTFNGTFDSSTTGTNDNDNDIYVDKINQLSLQLEQQIQITKERDAELKRLRSITIEIPTDQVIRDYICYFADKIKQQTIGHRYIGNLTNDARRLGIGVEKLSEVLNSKAAISSVAREIFKRIIPVEQRSVNHWNKLSVEVIVKEKVLIEFLERYYGALEVDPKKIHISLVGCLRNHRGKQNKLKQQVEKCTNNNEDDDHVNEITYVAGNDTD
ncbi:unnamed protein product [Rotaria sp. Silwood2]|nr:unnamed protein product [Rotaria sp. Silwood2]CAF3046965.1 unnamed protein product [Rotaria sp. Silwood2]CAF4246115.1 unnamed protein product [Rotaria sp. Silwood2]CAF4258698.1 unnamed protein product [Rotaria sp. Silwood2]